MDADEDRWHHGFVAYSNTYVLLRQPVLMKQLLPYGIRLLMTLLTKNQLTAPWQTVAARCPCKSRLHDQSTYALCAKWYRLQNTLFSWRLPLSPRRMMKHL